MLDYELLEKLCTAYGISGCENGVRSIIENEIKAHADMIKTDNLGNLIVFKKGKKTPDKKLLISAHMDEVGFIVTYITSDGCLKFTPVGGINDSAAFAKYVRIGKKLIPGVICAKPVHLLDGDEGKKQPSIDKLLIDIGAKDKADAQRYIRVGDPVMFDSPYTDSDGRIISKAIDDRFGCLVLTELIKSELEYDTWFSFTVQEEVGLRGAKTAAFSVEPDCAVVVEATTASDVPFSEEEKKVCCVGEGAVVSFMDRSTIYDREYYELAMECAAESGVKAQTKTMIAGGNDAGAIHCSRGGVRTIAVSVPCRYIHSSAGLACREDMEAVFTVVKALAERILAQ